jgi:hypothetical protein
MITKAIMKKVKINLFNLNFEANQPIPVLPKNAPTFKTVPTYVAILKGIPESLAMLGTQLIRVYKVINPKKIPIHSRIVEYLYS